MNPDWYANRVRTSDADFVTGQIDERWLREWVAFGIADLERMLHNDAIYRAWCADRGIRP